MSFYSILDHTADLGISVTGNNRKHLYKNAALALTDLLTDINDLRPEHTETVTITGHDPQDLLINWLREILYFWNGKTLFASGIHITDISDTTLTAGITVTAYVPDHHKIHRDIKAVTYHQAQVREKDGQWKARVIFDV